MINGVQAGKTKASDESELNTETLKNDKNTIIDQKNGVSK